MDIQLTVIFIIFGLLFVLEQYEKYQESYTNVPNVHLEPGFYPVNYSVNIGDTKNFGNFGTFGSYPPYPLCGSCTLQDGSNPLPIITLDDHGRVSRSCSEIDGKNYADLSRPFLVQGRANGRVRQCRRII